MAFNGIACATQRHTVEVHPQHLDGLQWDRLQQHSVIQWRFTHNIWMAFNGIACSTTVSYSEGSPTASGWPSMGSPAATQCHTVEVHPQHLDGLQWDRLQQHSVIQWRFTHSIWMAFNGIACSNTVSYSEGSPIASRWPSMDRLQQHSVIE